MDEGTLYILGGSHAWDDVRQQFEALDVDKNKSWSWRIQMEALELVKQKHRRFLTTSFSLGDCLIFGMFTVHGSFDNNSVSSRIKL